MRDISESSVFTSAQSSLWQYHSSLLEGHGHYAAGWPPFWPPQWTGALQYLEADHCSSHEAGSADHPEGVRQQEQGRQEPVKWWPHLLIHCRHAKFFFHQLPSACLYKQALQSQFAYTNSNPDCLHKASNKTWEEVAGQIIQTDQVDLMRNDVTNIHRMFLHGILKQI